METKEIEALFESLARKYGVSADTSKQIFTLLVQITLRYRDMLVARKEKALTVDETRKAIDELLHVIQHKPFSQNVPKRIQDLVRLWYDEVKLHLFH